MLISFLLVFGCTILVDVFDGYPNFDYINLSYICYTVVGATGIVKGFNYDVDMANAAAYAVDYYLSLKNNNNYNRKY
jgi:hypothetical protein